MTKTEFKAQGVEELRAALLDLFEDTDGTLSTANKTQLREFADDNWEYIDSQINQPEEEPDAEEEEDDEEVEEIEEGEEVEEEVLTPAVDLVEAFGEEVAAKVESLEMPDPRTDLYTHRMGGVNP